MSGSPVPESLSYFNFQRRRQRSSHSSPPISPATLDEPPPTHTQPPSRPVFRNRPHSDYSTIRAKVKVQTIEEGVIAVRQSSTSELASNIGPQYGVATRKSTTRVSGSSTTPVRLGPEDLRHTAQSKGNGPRGMKHGSEPSVSPPARPRPKHVWSRSKSGGIWYERLKQSPSQSQHSSLNSNDSQAVPPRLLTPLRPPLTPVYQPVYHHQVKVETSFTQLRPDKRSSIDQVASRAPTSLAPEVAPRRSSIDPRRFFSAPLRLARRFSKQGTRRDLASSHAGVASPRASSKLQLPDHRSYLRRNQTGEALKQVTSILEQTSPSTVINPLFTRAMSDKSVTGSFEPKKHEHDKKVARGLVSTSAMAAQKSLQDLARYDSQTSSQLALRRGLQPQNTPDEQATYKIRRSPSAETEEFLKVDISIRGGTSYLPSEARRIHTPPLPQDGPDGKKRGFFFDYNAPKNDASRRSSVGALLVPGKGQIIVPRSSTSKASTIGRRAMAVKRRITKSKTGDWYDAKLAELETDEDDESQIRIEELVPPANRCRSTTTTSCSELTLARKKKEEEQMDYNIPEHLPSSPLCPRNKRYWRVIQGRGSQYRGCWMHGTGEYE